MVGVRYGGGWERGRVEKQFPALRMSHPTAVPHLPPRRGGQRSVDGRQFTSPRDFLPSDPRCQDLNV